jgi:cytochrome c-type biogenesis protein CcmF
MDALGHRRRRAGRRCLPRWGSAVWEISLGAAFGLALGVWLIGGALWELRRRAVTLNRVFRVSPRVWGMTLAHMGIGLFIIGAVDRNHPAV